MATRIKTDDHVHLHVEEAGTGTPIVFVHEFAGDHRSWEPQVRFFSRRHRCVAYAARGYIPSDVPTDPEAYSQKRVTADIACVMDGLGIEKAHVVGLSMGGFATLHFGLDYPARALSLTIAGAGYGCEPAHREQFQADALAAARSFEEKGIRNFSHSYASGASRVQFQNKDPRGWNEFATRLGEHSDVGSALTMRGYQARRPSFYDLEAEIAAIAAPTLILVGDEDDHCIQPGVFLKKTITTSGLAIFPKTGHTLNLEEPDLFNRHLAEFIAMVESGKWGKRDPRALPSEIMRSS